MADEDEPPVNEPWQQAVRESLEVREAVQAEIERRVPRNDPKYWEALGQFVEAFAVAELALFQYMQTVSGMSEHVARIVARSWHTNQISEFIRACWLVTPLAPWCSELKDTLDHLGTIGNLRNAVIHSISYVTPQGERISSNVDRVMPTKTIEARRVSPDLLNDARDDSILVSMRLVNVILHHGLPLAEREALMWKNTKTTPEPLLTRAWRYKHPPNLGETVPPLWPRNQQS